MGRLLLLASCLSLALGQELLSTISCSNEERSALAQCGRSLGQFQEPLKRIHEGGIRDFLSDVGENAKVFQLSCPFTETFKFCARRILDSNTNCKISSCYIRACESLKGQPNKSLYIEENLLCIVAIFEVSNPSFTSCVHKTFPANARNLPLDTLAARVPRLVACVEPEIYKHCGPSVVNLLHLIDPSNGLCLLDLGGSGVAPPAPPTPINRLSPPGPPQAPSAQVYTYARGNGEGTLLTSAELEAEILSPELEKKPQRSSRQFSFKETESEPSAFRVIPASSSFSVPTAKSDGPMPDERESNTAHQERVRSFNRDVRTQSNFAHVKNEFTCKDHLGHSHRRGTEFIDEEGSFFLRCPLTGTEPELVACVDGSGARKAQFERWRTADGFFVNECVIGPPGPSTHKTIACVTADGEEVANGTDWVVGRFYQRCVLDPFKSGWSFIKVVACEDDYGNRVVNGTEWPSDEFMYYRRCSLDNGDGQNRIVTVACTDENGERVEDGESWESLDGLFTKTCRVNVAAGSGQIESAPRRVAAEAVNNVRGCLDDDGNLVVNGSEWSVANGRFSKACLLRGDAAFVPVVACIDDSGQRVENGTEWPSLDYLYFQRCHLDSGDGRNRIFTIGCADDEGRKRGDGVVWKSRDGTKKKCVLDKKRGTGQIEILDFVSSSATTLVRRPPLQTTKPNPSAVCSLEDGRRFLNNTEWLMENRRFYKKCVIGDGWFNTPVVACVDDLGNRIPNGTIFPTIDFLYFQRCQLKDGSGQNRIFTVSCADEEGSQVAHRGEWTDSKGIRKRCVLDSSAGTGQIQLIRTSFPQVLPQGPPKRTKESRLPAAKLSSGDDHLRSELAKWALELAAEATCIDDQSGRVVENGTEWLPEGGRFYKRCVVEEGWSYIAVVACQDDFGNRVPNATVWPTKDLLYFQRCSLDSGDGLNRIFTVGCADESGARREDGAEWLSTDGRTRKRCVINHFNGTAQIEVFPNLSPVSEVLRHRQRRTQRHFVARSRAFVSR